MKKFLFMFALMLGMVSVSNAQIATQNSKILDNVGIGVTVGETTPLDFNSVFPLNTNFGIKLTKDFTPVVGVEIEGTAFLNENNFKEWTHTFVKGTNVGLNGTINLTNLLCDYLGSPRAFEVRTNTGLGWMHRLNNGGDNALTGKTGLDFNFNLGKNKAHTVAISPAVHWILGDNGKAIQFNKNRAQLGINVSYIYHFKTSNGTHAFKTFDVGAMNYEINHLRSENNRLDKENDMFKKRGPKVVEKVIIKEKPVLSASDEADEWEVKFAFNDATVDDAAKFILNQVGPNSVVDITATASPEGSDEYNLKLSEARAKNVADYLISRGVKVNSAVGLGADCCRGRSAIVTLGY